MRWPTLLPLAFALPLLTGCKDDKAAEIERLRGERDAARRQVEQLQPRVGELLTLVQQQNQLVQGAQAGMVQAIQICRTSNDDTQIRSQLDRLTRQCADAVGGVNSRLDDVARRIAPAGTGPTQSPDCTRTPVPPGCPSTNPTNGTQRSTANPAEAGNAQTPPSTNASNPPPQGPGGSPAVRPGDSQSDRAGASGGGDSERQLLLAAAFIACEFYSAGTCSFVVAMVGLRLGLSGDEVRQQSRAAFEQLSEDTRRRGIAIPGPHGGEIVLRVDLPVEVRGSIAAYNRLSAAQQRDRCAVLRVFRDGITPLREALRALGSPYLFTSEAVKSDFLRLAERIDPVLVNVIRQIPVRGAPDATPVSCD